MSHIKCCHLCNSGTATQTQGQDRAERPLRRQYVVHERSEFYYISFLLRRKNCIRTICTTYIEALHHHAVLLLCHQYYISTPKRCHLLQWSYIVTFKGGFLSLSYLTTMETSSGWWESVSCPSLGWFPAPGCPPWPSGRSSFPPKISGLVFILRQLMWRH